jgi:hypothetical protein
MLQKCHFECTTNIFVKYEYCHLDYQEIYKRGIYNGSEMAEVRIREKCSNKQ